MYRFYDKFFLLLLKKHVQRRGKTATSILLTIAFLFTNIFPVFNLPLLLAPQEVKAATSIPLSMKFDNFNDTSLLQLNGTSATTVVNSAYVLRLTPAAVGSKASTYSMKRISLANDRSFSTYFKFRISDPYNPWRAGEGGDGFTFTLQTVGSTICGTSNPAMASDGTAPSVTIEFDTYEDSGAKHIGINTNGSTTSLAQVNTPYSIWDGNEYHVWIDYDGLNNQMEVRINQNSDARPSSATLTKTGLDLATILDTDDVFAGFTAATGSAYEAHDILSWYFNNDYSSIDVINNTYIDASQLTLTANPLGNTSSSTLTAEVSDMLGNPIPNIPVSFTTDMGVLSLTAVTSDASGQAVVTLDAGMDTGTATVTAVAQGGAYGTVSVGLISDPDEVAVANDKAALEITFSGTDTAASVTQALGALPTTGANGTTITWVSDNTTVLSSDGQTVNRPAYTEGDALVNLTATISKGTASDTKVFPLTVKALAMSDAEAVAADKAALEITFNGTDTAASVTQALGALPTAGANGTTITWVSDNTTVLSSDGQTVNRPTYTNGDALVNLTATITKGSASDTKVFPLTVKALTMSDAEAVAADKTNLTITFNGTDSANSVTQALGALPTAGANGTTITWASNNTAVVSNDGQTVNRPSYSAGDTIVTLTATISKGIASDTKVFNLTVKALSMSDAEAVAADRAALAIAFNGADTASSVTQNLILPTAGANGTTISWFSSKSFFISSTGVVRRPSRYTGDLNINLTAIIKKGTVFQKKYFTVRVLADLEAPRITSTVPAEGSVRIARGEPFQIKFSEPVYKGQNFYGVTLFELRSDFFGNVSRKWVKVTPVVNGDTLTITPAKELFSHTGYQLVIPSDVVRDGAGNPFQAPRTKLDGRYVSAKVYLFITASHLEAPVIVNNYPSDNAEGIALNQQITITFDEPIMAGPANGEIAIKDAAGKKYTVAQKISGKTLTLKPTLLLENSTRYQVTLPLGSIKTTSNKDLAEPFSFSFTTGNFEVASQPEDGETNVSTDKVIVVKYAGDMQPGPNLGSITVKDPENNSLSIDCIVNNGVLLINPDHKLAFGTEYTVNVPAGALSDSNGVLNGEYVFSFTTAEEIIRRLPGFQYSPVTQIEGDPINFSASHVFDQVGKDFGRKVTGYAWDFGDGNIGRGETVSHKYDTPGSYTVTLTVTDDKGQEYTLSNDVLIKSLADVTMTVTPEGNLRYQNRERSWGEIFTLADVGPQFTVKLDTEGVPLVGKKLSLYNNGSLIKEFLTEDNGKITFKIDQIHLRYGDNLLSFKSSGQTAYRLVRHSEEGASNYKIKLKNTEQIPGIKFYIDGVEKNPVKDWEAFYVFDNLTMGLHDIKITAPYYYDKEYTVDLYRQQQVDTIEMERNEPSDKPLVRWVTSKYSDSRKGSKDFIRGVRVPVDLTAKVDWKGHKPGYIKFITPDKEYKDSDGIKYFNLGSDIRAGGNIRVVAVSAFGTESAAVDAGIRIVTRPPVGSVRFDRTTGEYEFDMNGSMPSAMSPNAPSSLPFFAGNSVGLDSDHFKLSGGMTNNGKLVFNVGVGGDKEKTKKRNLKAPKKDYEVEVGGVKIEGFLGAEFTYAYRQDINEWAFEEGTITVQVNGSATKQQYFLIPVVFVPGYVGGTIGLNTETGLEISKDFTANKTEYQGMVMIGPNAEIVIGAGGGEFKVEGYLNGEVDFQYTFPVNKLTVEAELNGGVRAQAWVFSWENNLLHYEWEYPEETSAKGMSLQAASFSPTKLVPEDAEFKPSSREYLKEGSTWVAPAGNTIRALSFSPESISSMNTGAEGAVIGDVSSIIMENNIFPYPDPILINDESGTIMAWVADNPSRSDINRTEIRFSRFDGTGWSAPQFMKLDDSADFSPQLVNTSDGIVAVWENVYQALPASATLQDMAAGMEIAAAKSDAGLTGWSGFENLSSNNYLDHSPIIAASGDSAILIWIANRSNNLTGSATNPNEIMFSKWNGASWSEPAVILSNLGAVTYTSVAYNASEGTFAYIVDGDDDTATTGDQDLYVATYDGSQWSNPIRITDNLVQDANPQVTYVNNQLFMVWYQNGKVVYTSGIQSTPNTVPGISISNADFEMTGYGNDRLALVYSQPVAKGQNIYTSLYDVEVNSWSYPMQLTEGTGYLQGSLGPAFDQQGNLMIAHNKVELVTSEVNGVQYTNPGQADLGMVTFRPKHDLAVNASEIRLSENNPVPGSSVTITADITNTGDFSKNNVAVDFYNGDPAQGGTKIGTTQVIQGVIPARGSGTASVVWTVPVTGGSHRVYVVVDPEAKLQDSNRVNNTAYSEAVAPDIEISDLRYEPLGGTEYLITADISNVGSIDIGNAEITLYEGENENTLVTTQQVESLESGGQTQAVFIWDAADKEFVNDEFRLSTKLVGPAGVNEYTEDNNVYMLALVREALYVKSFAPAENSRTAPVDQGITIKFNTDIQEGPTFAQMVLLDETGTEVPAGKAVAGSTLTITPSQPLEYEKTYTFFLKAGDVTDLNGTDLGAEFILDFTTDKLHTNPVIGFTFPAADMVDAPLAEDINIVFNEEVMTGDNFRGIRVTDSYGWDVAVVSLISGNTLILNPATNLRYGTEYTVTIPQGAVLNNKGLTLIEDYSFTFTTLPDPSGSSSSGGSSLPESEVIVTDMVTEDGLKVVIVKTQLPGKKVSVKQAAAAVGAEMLSDPVEFKIQAQENNGTTKNIPDFKKYVPRTITLNEKIDPAKTTGVLYNPNTGKLIPVPTVFETVEGKTVATIKHQGSGIYIIIRTDNSFGDLLNHWAKNDIETLASKLVVHGKGENFYDPQGKVTRAEFATLLVRALGLTNSAGKAGFKDVSEQWYAEAVNKAAGAGLIQGYSDGTFRPTTTISRQEMAAMVRNAVSLAGISPEVDNTSERISKFIDKENIREWAREAVATAVIAGIVNGNDRGEFRPDADATRAEAAVMLMRTLGYVDFVN